MRLRELLATGAVRTRWPMSIDGHVIASSDLGPSPVCCRKCSQFRSCDQTKSPGEHQCTHGMTYYVLKISDQIVTVYGLRGERNTTRINSYNRDGFRGRSVSYQAVQDWAHSITQLLAVVESEFSARQSEMLDPLHDPMRLAKQVNTIANRLVQMHSHGATLEQQIGNASTELKTLVKASDLLSDSFDLLSIYFNPDAAAFGKRVATSPHGLITKLIAIFRIDDGGITRSSTKIFVTGSCYRNILVHESFKLIPFALLSNAIKYSMLGNIDVVVDDRRQYVELSVTSTGPYIEDSERELIFTKRGRGRWAEKLTDGRGVGLYLAQIIARAHGSNISVKSSRLGQFQDEVPLARNTFSLQIPTSWR